MLQGHESAVIRKRRRPVLDRARNIRQIVVRGSRTDPPTVSGAKGRRRPTYLQGPDPAHRGPRPGWNPLQPPRRPQHPRPDGDAVGAHSRGSRADDRRYSGMAWPEKLGPSPSPRQKNPRQRVKAPPPADRPIRRRYRSAGPGAPPVVHQGRPGPTAPPIPEPRPVSPSTGTVETVTASTPPIRAADPPSDGRAWAAARGLVGSRSGGRALPRSGIAVRRSVKLGADQSRPPLGGRGGVGKAPPTYCVGLTRARALGRPAVALLSKELRRRALPRSGRRVAT